MIYDMIYDIYDKIYDIYDKILTDSILTGADL